MKKQSMVCTLAAAAVIAVLLAASVRGQITSAAASFLQQNMALLSLLPEPQVDPLEYPAGKFKAVKPQEFDPGRTHLVQAAWLHGIGCPTKATIAIPNAEFTAVAGFAPYSDAACGLPSLETGDPQDQRNEGLLLAKTGPTITNFASAAAELINVKGLIVDELGYDIRKFGGSGSPLGSHCGAGAPRFLVLTSAGPIVIGCNSPAATDQITGQGWTRLRWTMTTPTAVQRILIIFDEGQDPSGGPDFFGAAILDNISVNGVMVGRGAVDAS